MTLTDPSPAVSIIIPTYNRGKVLAKAISSILAQSFTDFEIVIVDDGSADDTATVVQSMTDPRVRYWAQKNVGAAAARNRGVELSSGLIVTFLDSDDTVLPNWLDTMMRPFAGDAADLVFCGAQVVRDLSGQRVSSLRLPRPLGPAFNNLTGLFLAGTYALRRNVFEMVGGFDFACSTGQHTDFALRLAELSERRALRVHSVMTPHVRLVDHAGERLSQNPQKRLDGTRYLIAKHGSRLRKDRRTLASYWGIAGVCAHKLRAYELASSCFLEAVKVEPLGAKGWLRYLMSMTGLVPPWVWARSLDGKVSRKQPGAVPAEI